MNYYQLPTGDGAPQIVNVVVEVPAGTRNKVEYDPVLEVFRVDRVLYSPIHYPGDYGFLPSTLSPDGDALDVLVLVTDPTFTGCVLSARPIGLLDMRDEAGADEKVLAVPETDPRFEEIEDLPICHSTSSRRCSISLRCTKIWKARKPHSSGGTRRQRHMRAFSRRWKRSGRKREGGELGVGCRGVAFADLPLGLSVLRGCV